MLTRARRVADTFSSSAASRLQLHHARQVVTPGEPGMRNVQNERRTSDRAVLPYLHHERRVTRRSAH